MSKYVKYKLKQLSTFEYGKMPDKEKIMDEGYPIFSGYKINGYYPEYMYDTEKLVLIARGVGGTGKVRISPKKSYITNLSIIFNENKDLVDYVYLYYHLSQLDLKRALDTGSCQSQITTNELGNFEVFIPQSIEEQQKIAKVLSTIDDKIELNNKINSELEAMAKELYEYWFVQFDFPDENGKPYKSSGGKMVWNDELKREIPEGWEVKTLGDIIVENKKSPFKVSDANGSGEYPFFTSGADILLHDEALVDGLNCYLNTGGNGDVKVYNGKSAYSGDTWCIKGKNNSTAYLSQILLSFRPRLDIKFFAGTGLQHLQKDLLKMENIVMPHKNILDKFNEDIETITLKISNNKKQNKDLTELRDFLLPMLMNGQVTVK